MFSHPVAGLGKVCILLGVVAAGLAFSLLQEQASPLLFLGSIAIGLGFSLLLLGVVAQGFFRIERYLSGIPEMKAAFDATEPKVSVVKGNPYQKKAEQ